MTRKISCRERAIRLPATADPSVPGAHDAVQVFPSGGGPDKLFGNLAGRIVLILGVIVVAGAIFWLVATGEEDSALSSSALSAVPGLPGPAPNLSPAQVVQTIMGAMQRNNDPQPDAGIKT